MKELKPDALLLGEVWEDASNKIAYGVRRKYFVDGLLDGVMNYPWRTAILQYVLGEDDGAILCDWVMRLAENYPAEVLNSTMLSLSTHDTRRILTALGDQFEGSREDGVQNSVVRRAAAGHGAGEGRRLFAVLPAGHQLHLLWR